MVVTNVVDCGCVDCAKVCVRVKNVNYYFVHKRFMNRSFITTTNECSNLVIAWKTRYRFLSKAGVSSCPPLPDCFESHPDSKTIKSYPITGLDRPLGLQEVEAPRICRQSEHEGGKFVSSTYRPPEPRRRHSWCSFLLEAESTPGP